MRPTGDRKEIACRTRQKMKSLNLDMAATIVVAPSAWFRRVFGAWRFATRAGVLHPLDARLAKKFPGICYRLESG